MKTADQWTEVLKVLSRKEALIRILEMSPQEYQELELKYIMVFGLRPGTSRLETAERILEMLQ